MKLRLFGLSSFAVLAATVSSFLLSTFVVVSSPDASIRSTLSQIRGDTQRRHNRKASVTASLSTSDERLIPRDVLFGNPKYASPTLSPDGAYLAYLSPSPDLSVLNVFVVEFRNNAFFDLTKAKQVTNDTSRGIRHVQWAEDSETLLYLQDFEGDENFHLWAVDAKGKTKARELTPGKNVKASTVLTNKRFPDQILVGTNQRDPTQFDMYRCYYQDPKRELELDTQNPGNVVGWGIEDETFEIRKAVVQNQKDSSTTVRIRDDMKGEWRDLMSFPYGEEGNLIGFCNDGFQSAYVLSTVGRDTKALLKVDLKTGKTLETISSNDQCDCQGVLLDENTKEVRLVSYNYARTEHIFFDEALEQDYEVLKKLGPHDSEVFVPSRTRDEKRWVVAYSRSDGPTEYALYNKPKKTTTPLFVTKPDLQEYKLTPMEDVRVPTRDGMTLVGYLSRAKTTENSKSTPAPLILLVHGGPWARDVWGFNTQVQWFTNRGYSCLQVNFRGSAGYGKTHLHKGDGQWGVGSMQHDLTDSVQWAVDQGIADPKKICIFGGSYGGYASLAGLAFTPDLYACGVDIVGPSNVKTLLDSIPPYWGPMRNQMLMRIGDVDTDTELNKRISPLFHVDSIKAPLMIGQGANDPRVKRAEADQIAFSMKAKGIPVEYVLYPDEGHGFARPDNQIDFNGRVELFLQEHLGGRAEDFEKPKGSTATFPLKEEEATSQTTAEAGEVEVVHQT